jgi:hypothetical protein
MSKPLALTAALLLLAGCNASNPTAPATTSEPSFLNNTTGCPMAADKTGQTPGINGVTLGCSSSSRP